MSSSYATVSAKLGKVEPATKSISKEIFDAAAKAGHEIWYMWGMGSSSEHATGRALDLMVKNKAAGDWIRNYIWTNRARLRLQHVIWWQHITSTVTNPGVVRLMEDRGSVTENHKDHVHVLFYHGDYRAPSSSSGTPSKASVTEVAKQIIRGEGGWGDGGERKARLKNAGYNYDAVQNEVRRLMSPKKTVNVIAKEVIRGDWGNGPERVAKLKKAGYDPKVIQAEVDRIFKK